MSLYFCDQQHVNFDDYDFAYICVPKGTISYRRFVDGYLAERPILHIALPINMEGDNIGEDIVTIYRHDCLHAVFNASGYFRNIMKPAYRRIRIYRNTLNKESLERRKLDVFLFWHFHEYDINKVYQLPTAYYDMELSDDVLRVRLLQLHNDVCRFQPFIRKMNCDFTPGQNLEECSALVKYCDPSADKRVTVADFDDFSQKFNAIFHEAAQMLIDNA
jgi:hypothetical protein